MANHHDISNPTEYKFSARERFVSSITAFLAMALVGLISIKTIGIQGFPYLVASMGASSVLLFAEPHSPLSQPWPLVGGHLISSIIGVFCLLNIPEPVLAAAAAVSLSIAGMHAARCLHPPGGAVALATVLGGQQVADLGFTFVIFPVMVNTLVMLAAAMLLNNTLPGRHYPAKGRLKDQADSDCQFGITKKFRGKKLRSALSSQQESVRVSEKQLSKLCKSSAVPINQVRLMDICCEQFMSLEVVVIRENTLLKQAWRELQNRSIKAAPVVDDQNRLRGIITLTGLAEGFMEKVSVIPPTETAEQQINHLNKTPVSRIMTTSAITVHAKSRIGDALPLFLERKICYLPVVEGNDTVVGMLAETDLLALFQSN
jgi:CBS domain-containing membrane protein